MAGGVFGLLGQVLRWLQATFLVGAVLEFKVEYADKIDRLVEYADALGFKVEE